MSGREILIETEMWLDTLGHAEAARARFLINDFSRRLEEVRQTDTMSLIELPNEKIMIQAFIETYRRFMEQGTLKDIDDSKAFMIGLIDDSHITGVLINVTPKFSALGLSDCIVLSAEKV